MEPKEKQLNISYKIIFDTGSTLIGSMIKMRTCKAISISQTYIIFKYIQIYTTCTCLKEYLNGPTSTTAGVS